MGTGRIGRFDAGWGPRPLAGTGRLADLRVAPVGEVGYGWERTGSADLMPVRDLVHRMGTGRLADLRITPVRGRRPQGRNRPDRRVSARHPLKSSLARGALHTAPGLQEAARPDPADHARAPGERKPRCHQTPQTLQAHQKPDLAPRGQIWLVIVRPPKKLGAPVCRPGWGEPEAVRTSGRRSLVRDGGGIGRARPVSRTLFHQRGEDGRWRLIVSLREHQTGQVQTTPRAMAAPFRARPAPGERSTSVPAIGL